METNELNAFLPSHPVHPFEILEDEIEARGISYKEFARQIAMAPSNFSRMLKMRGELTSEMALKLEKVLGIPYIEWMSYQESYLKDKTRIEEKAIGEARDKSMEDLLNKNINLDVFYKRLGLGLKPIKDRLREITPYIPFILNPDKLSLSGLFKKSELHQTEQRNLLTWIMLARAEAGVITFDMDYTTGNARKAAEQFASMAHNGSVTKESTQRLLYSYGIGYGYVEKLEKTPVDAFSTMSGGVPCIIVTYRIKDRDKFIFDILHELGHIALHMENGERNSFVNCNDEKSDKYEKEADKFASDLLIPPAKWSEIMKVSPNGLNPHKISKLIGDKAQELGLSPSIAVSRYKHEIKTYSLSCYQSPKLI